VCREARRPGRGLEARSSGDQGEKGSTEQVSPIPEAGVGEQREPQASLDRKEKEMPETGRFREEASRLSLFEGSSPINEHVHG
jgi:hypothetical protein